MILTTPRRLIILQLLHLILTDGLTFISVAPLPQNSELGEYLSSTI